MATRTDFQAHQEGRSLFAIYGSFPQAQRFGGLLSLKNIKYRILKSKIFHQKGRKLMFSKAPLWLSTSLSSSEVVVRVSQTKKSDV